MTMRTLSQFSGQRVKDPWSLTQLVMTPHSSWAMGIIYVIQMFKKNTKIILFVFGEQIYSTVLHISLLGNLKWSNPPS